MSCHFIATDDSLNDTTLADQPDQWHVEPDWVLAAPFRAHLRRLMDDHHQPWRVMALGAGVPSATVRSLLFGRRGRPLRRIRHIDAVRLLRLSDSQVARWSVEQVVATEASQLLTLLLQDGVSLREIGEWVNHSEAWLTQLAGGRMRMCTRADELRLRASCEARDLELCGSPHSIRRAA